MSIKELITIDQLPSSKLMIIMIFNPPIIRTFALIIVLAGTFASDAAEDLPAPQSLIVSVGQEQTAQPILLAARRYAAFWNSGEAHYAEAALATNFIDRTLPPNRAQGIKGVLAASKTFRAAIPDLKAEIEEILIINDRAVIRYVFSGHFSGTFEKFKGDGHKISFRAVDIYRVQNGQISDNWHLEDNLSLMQQLQSSFPIPLTHSKSLPSKL